MHIRKLVSNEGFKEAEKLLIKNIQLTSFQTEVGTLLDLEVRSPETATELRSKSSRITSLNPFIDQEGFLRVGGRLGKAENLPYEVRFPAILPARDGWVSITFSIVSEKDITFWGDVIPSVASSPNVPTAR